MHMSILGLHSSVVAIVDLQSADGSDLELVVRNLVVCVVGPNDRGSPNPSARNPDGGKFVVSQINPTDTDRS